MDAETSIFVFVCYCMGGALSFHIALHVIAKAFSPMGWDVWGGPR